MTLAKLRKKLNDLRKGPLEQRIRQRLGEFKAMQLSDNEAWFSELCFCILTANSKAATALEIQKEMGYAGFSKLKKNEVAACIRGHGHRFHNTKAGYIEAARCHLGIKDVVTGIVKRMGLLQAREWLVENVHGYGYKEASHFLRNVGYDGLAIIDRHVINLMLEYGIVKEKPKTLSRKNYLLVEKQVQKVADAAHMGMAELDLYLWYMKAGDVLK